MKASPRFLASHKAETLAKFIFVKLLHKWIKNHPAIIIKIPHSQNNLKKKQSHLPASQHPTAITIVARMKIKPMGSPKMTTERKAPMKGAKA